MGGQEGGFAPDPREASGFFEPVSFDPEILQRFITSGAGTEAEAEMLRGLRRRRALPVDDPETFEFDPAAFDGAVPGGRPTSLVKRFLGFREKFKESALERQEFLNALAERPGREAQIVARGVPRGGNTNNVVQSILARQQNPVESILSGGRS